MAVTWMKHKYRAHKPVKMNKAAGGNSGNHKRKKQGKKTYVYGSRVMLMDGGTGKTWMVPGDAA